MREKQNEMRRDELEGTEGIYNLTFSFSCSPYVKCAEIGGGGENWIGELDFNSVLSAHFYATLVLIRCKTELHKVSSMHLV